MNDASTRILSLYRSLLREAGKIQYNYPRIFWRLRIKDSFRRAQQSELENVKPSQSQKRLRDRARDLRRLEEANSGKIDSVRWMLQHAYGRRGKLRSEILSNIANDPNTPERDPIIPQAPSTSRPPKLPDTLVSIMGFTHARTTQKPLSPATLYSPPALPLRATDPNSEEARLLGPFSLRRTKNIHERFIRNEMSRTMPPLELCQSSELISQISPGNARDTSNQTTSDPIELALLGIKAVGLEGTTVFQELEQLAAPPSPPKPRRARTKPSSTNVDDNISQANLASPTMHEPRFMRRRFREILAQTPMLSYQQRPSPLSRPKVDHSPAAHFTHPGRWNASLSSLSLHRNGAMSSSSAQSSVMSEEDKAWIERASSMRQGALRKSK